MYLCIPGNVNFMYGFQFIGSLFSEVILNRRDPKSFKLLSKELQTFLEEVRANGIESPSQLANENSELEEAEALRPIKQKRARIESESDKEAAPQAIETDAPPDVTSGGDASNLPNQG
jgi:hypothetical protein